MLSSLIYFALLQVACALSIARPRSESNNPARLHSRDLTVNEKVAIGICVPGAALVVGLGIFILVLYPSQTRKLRQQNPGAQIGFAEVMAGRVTHQAPPKYTEQDSTNDLPLQNLSAPAQPTPRDDTRPAQQTPAEARHAALS